MELNINGWKISEEGINREQIAQTETIFALSNGYFGTRGSFEESLSEYHNDATYMNGFYDKENITYGESAYGYAKERQKMIDIPNGKLIDLEVDGERLSIDKSNIILHKRELDLQTGVLKREFIFETSSKKQVKAEIERFVSSTRKELMVINYNIKALNFSGNIKLISGLKEVPPNIPSSEDDPRVGSLDKRLPLIRINSVFGKEETIFNEYVTDSSKLYLALGVAHSLDRSAIYSKSTSEEKTEIVVDIDLLENEEVNLTKYVYYKRLDSKDEFAEARKEVEDLNKITFKKLKNEQKQYFIEFWEKSDVEIQGDNETQAAIRYNMFNLLQNVGKNGKTNICAKGLTGEGYDGHYFWDTEIYVMPFFVYTNPYIARKLLEYRYSILDAARDRAKEMSYEGALYPWRTINGQETSAYYPAGTAQIHINADICNAIKLYYEVTKDTDFIKEMGLEILVETSRFYKSYSEFIEGKGYCFNSVTGPDEYTAIVNNNAYTNMMIKNQISFLVDLIDELKISGLIKELPFNMTTEEFNKFKDMSENIYIKKIGNLTAQDDSFLEKAPWDFKLRPKKPLLLNYHPMVIYKYQVLKQADLVLAMYLLSDKFTMEEKKENYAYYEPLTTHDSSLSECIHGIVAAEIGNNEIAYKYFEDTVKTDLYDNHNNVKDGVHIAAMAGSWLGITAGFGGVRLINSILHLNPMLPDKWEGYKFKINYRDSLIEVAVSKSGVTANIVKGKEQKIVLYGKTIIVK